MNTLFVTRSFDFIWNVKSKLELFVSFFFFFFSRERDGKSETWLEERRKRCLNCASVYLISQLFDFFF